MNSKLSKESLVAKYFKIISSFVLEMIDFHVITFIRKFLLINFLVIIAKIAK